MSEWTTIPLSAQSYMAPSLPASAQRLVNMYPEALPDGAASRFVLLPTPGLKPWTSVGTGPCRGMRVETGKIFVISGEELYCIDSSKNATLLGTIPGTFDCHLTDNGTHVGIAADNGVYSANDADIVFVRAASMCGAMFQDGYGIYPQANSVRFYITGLDDDLTTIDNSDFSTADALGDDLVGGMNHLRDVWLLKQQSIEIWGNTGNASFPFERIPSGFIERGCAAPGSIAKDERSVVWLGNDLSVYASAGYQAQRISTGPIDALISAASGQSAARGFCYTRNGHPFYVLSFTNLTIVFDFKEGSWHERSTFGESRWRGHHYARLGDLDLVGDFETGAVYELDDNTYSDNDVANERIFTSAAIIGEGRGFIMDEVLLEAEAGVGNSGGGSDTDPSLFVRCSDNGGRGWNTPREAKLGQIGEYGKRVNWTRLGMAKNRILEFKTRASVKVASHACRARIEAMA